jgi:hypothetical protein
MAFVKVCDMHDLSEWWVEVEATRTFALDGRSYEIDLCGEHDAELDDALAPFVEHARKVRLGRR